MYLARDPASVLRPVLFKKPHENESNSNTFWFAYGRYALHEGLKALGLKSGDIVLCPETICDVVMAAFKPLGIEVCFYSLHDDLSIDWESVSHLVETKKVSALLVVHYFGVAQDIKKCRLYCDAHEIFLIEDNAHGYGAEVDGKRLGLFGDIGFSSPRKILPVKHGAVLWVNSKTANTNLISTPKELEHETTEQIIKGLVKFVAPKINMPFYLLKKSPGHKMPPSEEDTLLPYALDTDALAKIGAADLDNIRERRVELYYTWQEFLHEHGLLPVFNEIPKGSMPLCFACYGAHHEEQNLWIEWGYKNDIDIYAWPSLPKACRVEGSPARLRWLKMLCFPINHELEKAQLIRCLQSKSNL